MEVQIQIVGILLILLAFLHGIFPKYFHWKSELKKLSLVNRQIMEIHTFFIALTLLLMGLLSICSSHELIHNPLGKKLSLGLGVFWLIRLLFQFFVYSPKLWKGKPFETKVHLLFSLLWSYITAVYFAAGFMS